MNKNIPDICDLFPLHGRVLSPHLIGHFLDCLADHFETTNHRIERFVILGKRFTIKPTVNR